MRGYLLDTHVLLWWLDDPERLSEGARSAITDTTNAVYVSAAAAWEIGIKQALGRIDVPVQLEQAVEDEGIRVLPISFTHGLAVAHLPSHHQDPFDRLMVAQAIAEELVLITRDPVVQQYDAATLKA